VVVLSLPSTRQLVASSTRSEPSGP